MISRLSEKICLKDKALLWMSIHYYLCQMHLVFHTFSLECLKGRDARLQKVPWLFRNENKYNNLLTHSPQWSSDRPQSIKAVKKCLKGDSHAVQTGFLLLGCHAQHIPPWERELSGPLFHSTTTDDCAIIFVLQAWCPAQLLHLKLILWHSGLSTDCSLSCCSSVPQVPSLLFSSIHFIASLLHGTATHLVGKRLISTL